MLSANIKSEELGYPMQHDWETNHTCLNYITIGIDFIKEELGQLKIFRISIT